MVKKSRKKSKGNPNRSILLVFTILGALWGLISAIGFSLSGCFLTGRCGTLTKIILLPMTLATNKIFGELFLL